MDQDGHRASPKIRNHSVKDEPSEQKLIRQSESQAEGDASFVDSLKEDWSVFWKGILGPEIEVEENEDPFESGKLESLNPLQVKDLMKALSQDRKRLHQRLELIKKEMDLNQVKLESLQLVGGDPVETIARVEELQAQGLRLHQRLEDINDKIKWVREFEKERKHDFI